MTDVNKNIAVTCNHKILIWFYMLFGIVLEYDPFFTKLTLYVTL